jgi:hypothetical protein
MRTTMARRPEHWTCPNPLCVDPETGRPSRWRLRILSKTKKWKKSIACLRCRANRPATEDERQLLASTDCDRIIGSIASKLTMRVQRVDFQTVRQFVHHHAVLAAMRYVPEKKSRFESYLYGYITLACTPDNVIRQDAWQKAADPSHSAVLQVTDDIPAREEEPTAVDPDTIDRLMRQADLTIEERDYLIGRFGLFGRPQRSHSELFPGRPDLAEAMQSRVFAKMRERCDLSVIG